MRISWLGRPVAASVRWRQQTGCEASSGPRLRRMVAVVAAASIAVAGLASCNRAKPVDTTEVVIRDRSFDPPYIKAERGATVWWINNSGEDHVISFRGFDSVEIFVYAGTKRGFAFSESREYKVYCKIHHFEGRVLIVEPAAQ